MASKRRRWVRLGDRLTLWGFTTWEWIVVGDSVDLATGKATIQLEPTKGWQEWSAEPQKRE